MEYFDFHVHAFTDSLAERAMSGLSDTSGIKPATDGTLGCLKRTLKENGIGKAMLLPIATKPSQQTNINNWAAEVMGEGIYCCGSVHPDAEDVLAELERIKSLGLFGIKFHSEYQFFCPDDEKMFPIYEKMEQLGLPAVFHGGWDPYGRGEIKATPKSFSVVAEEFPGLKIVAAHLGGMEMWDDVEKHLAGKYENVWFDIGVVSQYIDDERAYGIIRRQGVERVLFGSDCPWDHPENEIAMINRMSFTEAEKELIFHKNAEKLLLAVYGEREWR